MDDRTFQLILTFLELSWPGYRRVRKSMKKRLARHMRACGCRSASDVDLIFLRNNLLTYYLPPAMLPAFSRIIAALRTDGLLVVGLNEAAPLAGLPLKPRPEHPCIFEKTYDSGQAEAAPREDVSSA
ncbi:MAG: hypothetical protein N2F24_03425 [Deltaproteobacteria bacterium]